MTGLVIEQRKRSIRVTAPIRYEVHNRRRGRFSSTVNAVAEVIIGRYFTRYAILIPDRRKATWRRKQKFEAYLSGLSAPEYVPFDGARYGWGRSAEELIQSLYWKGMSAGVRKRELPCHQ